MISDSYSSEFKYELADKFKAMKDNMKQVKLHLKNADCDLIFDGKHDCKLRLSELHDAKSRYDEIVFAENEFADLCSNAKEFAILIEQVRKQAKQDVLDVCQMWEDFRKELEEE